MSKNPLFEVKDLNVKIADKQIIKGLSLKINPGEVHALMGRNGCGKTTLSNTLMGHPSYEVLSGDIILDGESLNGLSPEERAQKKLFLAFQYPVAIPGVTVANFLRTSIRAIYGQDLSAREVRKMIKDEMKVLNVPDHFMNRSLNDGFSGGEKKRLETLQMRLLKPKMAILDETDSGLDIDALRLVSENIEQLRDPSRGILVITHYQRMLNYIKPDVVHVMMNGKIVKTGGPELALDLEERGYDWLSEEIH
tara:strand:+ start:1742 stop:2494 length:753 start_codon:yes stop_codon:yes gene_type:complete